MASVLRKFRAPKVSFSRVDRIYDRMLKEELNGAVLNDIVGSGDPRVQGERAAALLASEGLVTSSSRVLEIGSGCGRAALALTNVLGSGRYVGVDIIPGLTRFCADHITAGWDNFTFRTLSESNPQYTDYLDATPGDPLAIGDLSEVGGEYDVVFAFSVFTHLQPQETELMLTRAHALLAPTGSLLFTAFLLDPFSRLAIREGRAAYFNSVPDVDTAPCVTDEFNGPNSAVAYDTAFLSEILQKAGFTALRSVRAGTWRSGPGSDFQDVVVAGKSPELPAGFDPAGYLRLNPDVERAGMGAANHYLLYGRYEDRVWRDG
jgi:SAM-dependent methyltransferase